MDQLLGQQHAAGLGDGDGSRADMPAEQTAQLSFANLEQWEQWQKNSLGRKAPEKVVVEVAVEVAKAPRKKRTYNEQRELDLMETTIQKAERHLEELVAKTTDEKNAANGDLMNQLYREISLVQSEIERLYKRWSELEAQ